MAISSPHLHAAFTVDVIPVRMAENLEQLRHFSLKKIMRSLLLYVTVARRLITHLRPSLIYLTLTPRGFGFFRDVGLVMWFRAFRIPHAFHMHGRGVKLQSTRSILYHALYRFVFAEARVIVMSEHLYADVARFVSRERTYVVPNGIADYPSNQEIGNLLSDRQQNSVPTLLFLSSMLLSKGPLVFLEALQLLASRNLPFNAVFAGSWRGSITPDYFNARVMAAGLSNCVRHVGLVHGDNKRQLFRDADIFVLPTDYENEAFPLVVLEAYAYGLPAVTSNVAGLPDIVLEDQTGFLIPPNDTRQLADKLQRLILDPALRIRLGKEARQHFEARYTSDEFGRNLSSSLQLILSNVPTTLHNTSL
jgi:glycosyltransferase involved in cell wall biosynthesis